MLYKNINKLKFINITKITYSYQYNFFWIKNFLKLKIWNIPEAKMMIV